MFGWLSCNGRSFTLDRKHVTAKSFKYFQTKIIICTLEESSRHTRFFLRDNNLLSECNKNKYLRKHHCVRITQSGLHRHLDVIRQADGNGKKLTTNGQLRHFHISRTRA
jgi:hypothetical protein